VWDRLEVHFGWSRDLVEELLGYADAVLVESPPDVRGEVVERLAAAVDGRLP
jgi:proteasome accessory factor B